MALCYNYTMQRIFVNIASLLDSELIPTIHSALHKSINPSNLHFSIVHQHTTNIESDISNIINHYGATFNYIFLNLEQVGGVGYARAMANETLTDEFKYYLQIDSHTRFRESWDVDLINSYNLDKKENNVDFIYSVFPKYYGYVDDQHWTGDSHLHHPNKIEDGEIVLCDYSPTHSGTIHVINVNENKAALYDFREKPWKEDFNYRITQYFTANFVFGESRYFIDIKYDPSYAYTGEEVSMSARFFAKGIKIVVPRLTPVWTDYDGHTEYRRANLFIDQGDFLKEEKSKIDWDLLQTGGISRLGKFVRGMIVDEFGITIENWNRFVKENGVNDQYDTV